MSFSEKIANIKTELIAASSSLSRETSIAHIFQAVMLLLVVYVIYEDFVFGRRVRELEEKLSGIRVQQNMEGSRRYDPRSCVRYGHAKLENTRRRQKKQRRRADKARMGKKCILNGSRAQRVEKRERSRLQNLHKHF